MKIMESCVEGAMQVMSDPGQEEVTHANFSQTKTVGDKSITITATGKDMNDIHDMLQLAGLEGHDAPVQVDEPACDMGDSEPDVVFTVPDQEKDQQELKDSIKNRLRSKWKESKGEEDVVAKEEVTEDESDPEWDKEFWGADSKEEWDAMHIGKQDTVTMEVGDTIPTSSSLWSDHGTGYPTEIHVTKMEARLTEKSYNSLDIYHDGPWTIYTDKEVVKHVNDILEREGLTNLHGQQLKADWSEQGMQREGVANMDLYVKGGEFDY